MQFLCVAGGISPFCDPKHIGITNPFGKISAGHQKHLPFLNYFQEYLMTKKNPVFGSKCIHFSINV